MAMRIAALLESSRHSCVEHLRSVTLLAGEWERRCVCARTSHGPYERCGSAARCGARL